jgi:hypothetical protein
MSIGMTNLTDLIAGVVVDTRHTPYIYTTCHIYTSTTHYLIAGVVVDARLQREDAVLGNGQVALHHVHIFHVLLDEIKVAVDGAPLDLVVAEQPTRTWG